MRASSRREPPSSMKASSVKGGAASPFKKVAPKRIKRLSAQLASRGSARARVSVGDANLGAIPEGDDHRHPSPNPQPSGYEGSTSDKGDGRSRPSCVRWDDGREAACYPSMPPSRSVTERVAAGRVGLRRRVSNSRPDAPSGSCGSPDPDPDAHPHPNGRPHDPSYGSHQPQSAPQSVPGQSGACSRVRFDDERQASDHDPPPSVADPPPSGSSSAKRAVTVGRFGMRGRWTNNATQPKRKARVAPPPPLLAVTPACRAGSSFELIDAGHAGQMSAEI